MDIKKVVATNIRKYRTKRGMTQAELASRCGVDVRYINRAENQPQNMCLDHLERIAEGLNTTPISLLASKIKAPPSLEAIILDKLNDIKDFIQQ